MPDIDIHQDPFVQGLKERLPSDLKESFTEEQLQALKVAFGARQWGKHAVDLRATFKLWRWRYYCVFLVGRNRRDLSRRQHELSQMAKAFVIAVFLLFSIAVGLVILYLIKSALNIDIFPNFSFGVWDWFKSQFN
ncbi:MULTISPECIES: 3-phosphoshikimate 1-carboxyvinyltransferase [Pseudomonas]|jgi:hypothetical protein|uniref:3-phosphoshikimate 1-carboxyvinyltransferase n=1 Tax=Pseudomonas lutea TaxID=243924 RepID=A0A9X8MB89_9PSED|nr:MULTISPECIES: 3-phosphoshikimate 1-carboxyvinyltransferase [Pseudomonas]SEQ20201.1 hypothetical protein SAMN05216409_104254 [Pseudomonas lutea]